MEYLKDTMVNSQYIKYCMEDIKEIKDWKILVVKLCEMLEEKDKIIQSFLINNNSSNVSYYLSYEDFKKRFQDYPEMMDRFKEIENNETI